MKKILIVAAAIVLFSSSETNAQSKPNSKPGSGNFQPQNQQKKVIVIVPQTQNRYTPHYPQHNHNHYNHNHHNHHNHGWNRPWYYHNSYPYGSWNGWFGGNSPFRW